MSHPLNGARGGVAELGLVGHLASSLLLAVHHGCAEDLRGAQETRELAERLVPERDGNCVLAYGRPATLSFPSGAEAPQLEGRVWSRKHEAGASRHPL